MERRKALTVAGVVAMTAVAAAAAIAANLGLLGAGVDTGAGRLKAGEAVEIGTTAAVPAGDAAPPAFGGDTGAAPSPAGIDHDDEPGRDEPGRDERDSSSAGEGQGHEAELEREYPGDHDDD